MNEFIKTIECWKYAPCSFLCKNTVNLNAIIKLNSPTSNTVLTPVYTLNNKLSDLPEPYLVTGLANSGRFRVLSSKFPNFQQQQVLTYIHVGIWGTLSINRYSRPNAILAYDMPILVLHSFYLFFVYICKSLQNLKKQTPISVQIDKLGAHINSCMLLICFIF